MPLFLLFKSTPRYNTPCTTMQSKTQPSRAPVKIDPTDNNTYMSQANLKICNQNQSRYSTPQLNDAFELHYYGFCNIGNLQPYANVNTLYLNNNVIKKIENLGHLRKLVTLNLANNRIVKIEGLEQLKQLFILDLSGNKIEKVENLRELNKLTTLNLSSNLLARPDSIADLHHNPKLTCLNISANPLSEDLQLYTHLQQMPLLTLFLKETPFSRSVPSYRKETICRIKTLTFLDERPVTKDERMMAEAWKEGGLQREKEVRKLIQDTRDQKNRKIYQEMMERSDKVVKMRDELYLKLTTNQRQELEYLKQKLGLEKLNENRNEHELRALQLKIQQLEAYLKYFRLDVDDMPVGQTSKIPNNLCERHEPNAIYLYGVTEDQLSGIKQVYFPDQTRPLIAVSLEKKPQPRWVQNYDPMLERVCHRYLHVPELIQPEFNLQVHDFDAKCGRKSRRFSFGQLAKKIEQITKGEAESELAFEQEAQNQLNVLD